MGLWAGFRGGWKGGLLSESLFLCSLRLRSNSNTFDLYLQDLRAICIYPVLGSPVWRPYSSFQGETVCVVGWSKNGVLSERLRYLVYF